jgi:hypothetical protein
MNIRVSAGRGEVIAAQGGDRDEQIGDQERREHVRDPDLLAFEQPKLRPTIRMPPMTGLVKILTSLTTAPRKPAPSVLKPCTSSIVPTERTRPTRARRRT